MENASSLFADRGVYILLALESELLFNMHTYTPVLFIDVEEEQDLTYGKS